MRITNAKVHKVEQRGRSSKVLIEFDADFSPAEGWTSFIEGLVEAPKPVKTKAATPASETPTAPVPAVPEPVKPAVPVWKG